MDKFGIFSSLGGSDLEKIKEMLGRVGKLASTYSGEELKINCLDYLLALVFQHELLEHGVINMAIAIGDAMAQEDTTGTLIEDMSTEEALEVLANKCKSIALIASDKTILMLFAERIAKLDASYPTPPADVLEKMTKLIIEKAEQEDKSDAMDLDQLSRALQEMRARYADADS